MPANTVLHPTGGRARAPVARHRRAECHQFPGSAPLLADAMRHTAPACGLAVPGADTPPRRPHRRCGRHCRAGTGNGPRTPCRRAVGAGSAPDRPGLLGTAIYEQVMSRSPRTRRPPRRSPPPACRSSTFNRSQSPSIRRLCAAPGDVPRLGSCAMIGASGCMDMHDLSGDPPSASSRDEGCPAPIT